VVADTQSLRVIAELAERRGELDAALVEAIRSARSADRSWSEIGAKLGVSKQAALRKYAKVAVSPTRKTADLLGRLQVDLDTCFD